MKTNKKKSFLSELPAWASTLIAMVIIFFVAMLIPEQVTESRTGEVIGYFVWGLLNATCCFFIVRQNPKSIWYVPLIINAFMTFGGITEADSWNNIIVIALCGAWLLSISASIIGVRMGRESNSGKSFS